MGHESGWLASSFIYLAAAVLAVPISRALGLGAIIGYLAAGMLIGPWGLGLVSEVQDILHFAEFGVVLMLFLVGLELEPRRLWQMRRPIFGWGSAQILLCAGGILGLGLLAGVPWRIALVAGLGLALSSTAIALQVLQERGQMARAGGQSGFAILLMQDVAAIPILALLPVLGVAGDASASGGSAWLEAGKAIGVVAGIILGGRLLLRPVLRWIARSDTPEIFTAAALLLVVGIAALMQAVGLSMALGAFLAGVLLAESEYRRELETDIEPFKGLLLGLFFMAVGMSIDFGVLLASPGTMLLVLLGFLAVKAVMIWGVSAAMGVPLRERPVLVLLLAQGGEFAFVVFQGAVGAQIFEARVSSLLIGTVALSMLLGPLLLVAIDRLLLPWLDARIAARDISEKPQELAEEQDNAVIIAGFGRYGQIVARVLYSQGMNCTVLDYDPELIETARQFGYTVHYGDATRLDLLRIAGAGKARVLVVAVDDPDQSLEIVELAQQHFPHLALVARARDLTHWNRLHECGVPHIERELLGSSLQSARSALEALGQTPHEARRIALEFRRRNIELAHKLHPHHKDRASLIAASKAIRQQLTEQLRQEREARPGRRAGWDNAVAGSEADSAH
ncbi:glutathione-regulated potassium-efflux system protein KefC [Amphibiibacter pelophylacis]|uniref:Glutathione-regulated potassium-efflux system protein KefC n=1 Tax=Amphibiibacter pelophylacis TaxID=1799477 RepID=A0ACC6NZI8_9BURK